MDKAVVCGNCVFWSRCVSHDMENYGYCKRYPPTITNSGQGNAECHRPLMMFDDWCGEYKEKRNDADRG